jgi:hypothetical protein
MIDSMLNQMGVKVSQMKVIIHDEEHIPIAVLKLQEVCVETIVAIERCKMG